MLRAVVESLLGIRGVGMGVVGVVILGEIQGQVGRQPIADLFGEHPYLEIVRRTDVSRPHRRWRRTQAACGWLRGIVSSPEAF